MLHPFVGYLVGYITPNTPPTVIFLPALYYNLLSIYVLSLLVNIAIMIMFREFDGVFPLGHYSVNLGRRIKACVFCPAFCGWG